MQKRKAFTASVTQSALSELFGQLDWDATCDYKAERSRSVLVRSEHKELPEPTEDKSAGARIKRRALFGKDPAS